MVNQKQRDTRDGLLNAEEASYILVDWVRCSSAKSRLNQEEIMWSADFPVPDFGELVAVWPGCVIGEVCDYGLKLHKDQYERAVWIKFDNGEFMKFTGREIKVVDEEDIKRVREQNKEFRKRLIGAGEKVVKMRTERRSKQVKGSHLLDDMLKTARDFDIDEKSSFYKITGKMKDKAVYVVRKGGRVDLSGFAVEHPAITTISEEEARQRHLGRVRGQINFKENDDSVMDAFTKALEYLTT